MIIARIIGGLGNQMFQYAAGRALSLANDCPLKLDISGFESYALHNGYELDIFNIEAEIAGRKDISSLTGSQVRLARILRQKLGFSKRSHRIEREFSFDPCFFDIVQPAYIDGYWQSYRYFESHAAQIRKELSFKKPLSGKNLEISGHVAQTSSVGVHIRRGDYITNPAFAKVHGFLGVDYYVKAVRLIRETIPSPIFVVFSEDIAWARENLQLGQDAVFVSHNTGMSSYEDMRLMSMCKHNIVANSSFSWWAAWLNNNPDKMVVYPSNWLAGRKAVQDYERFMEDLIPPTWIMV